MLFYGRLRQFPASSIFINKIFIECMHHDSNASNSIDHSYKYKVNEIYRTRKVNDWYCKSQYFDEDRGQVGYYQCGQSVV